LQLGTLCFQSHAAPGDVDLSFDPGSGVNGTVNAVAVQPDGKVIIRGQFTTVKGLLRTNVARLNADGSGDSSFTMAAGVLGDVTAVTVVTAFTLQSDGKVLVASHSVHDEWDEWGDAYEISEVKVTRLNIMGAWTAVFNPATGYIASYTATDYEGSFRSVHNRWQGAHRGDFPTMNGTNRNGIARLNADGSLDLVLIPARERAGVFIRSPCSQTEGAHRWLFQRRQWHEPQGIARLNANGSLDIAFNPGTGTGANGRVFSLALQQMARCHRGGFNAVNAQTATTSPGSMPMAVWMEVSNRA